MKNGLTTLTIMNGPNNEPEHHYGRPVCESQWSQPKTAVEPCAHLMGQGG